jgi:RNA polymerase sigma factor (sigma-70 family)
MVRRDDWAEDVAQAVFLLLARRAAKLKSAQLNAWLFNVTRYCSFNLLRSEKRREKWEKQAAIMKPESCEADPETAWQSIEPILEKTVHRLAAGDRDAVLLRFYQRKSMAEIGMAMGISEDAARKRVGKAIGRLRSMLTARGAVVPTVAVAASVLTEHTTQAAPAGVVAGFASGQASAAASHIANGVNQMFIAFKLKAVAALILLVLIPSSVWLAFHAATAGQVAADAAPAAVAPPPVAPPAAAAPVAQPADVLADDAELAPFYNSLTVLVASVDLNKIDLAALEARERAVLLEAFAADDVRRRDVEPATSAYRDKLSRTFSALKRAGVARAYPVVSGAQTTGLFVFPIGPDTKIGALNTELREPGVDSPDGHVRIYGAKQSAALVMRQMDTAESRPDLLEALSVDPNQAVRVVVVPRVLDHTGAFRTVFGLDGPFDQQWLTVKWCRAGLNTSPNLSATITIECNDADSAGAIAGLLTGKIAARKANPPSDPLEAKISLMLGDVKLTTSGSRVAFDLDQPLTEAILADWYWHDIQSSLH